MGMDAYETWQEDVHSTVVLYMGESWEMHSALVVQQCASALSKEVLRLWRGSKEYKGATWETFMQWTRDQLALNAQTEAEQIAAELFGMKMHQGSTNIQSHNLAFNRKVQRLQGVAAQSEFNLLILYRNTLSEDYQKLSNTLSEDYQKLSYYDASGTPFSTLAQVQAHLLKHESILGKKAKDASQHQKLMKNSFRHKKQRWHSRHSVKSNSETESVAAVQGRPDGGKASKQKTQPGKDQLISFPSGEEDKAFSRNDKISNNQAKWLYEHKRCVFCTGLRADCCPSKQDRCMTKCAVDHAVDALKTCPKWSRSSA